MGVTAIVEIGPDSILGVNLPMDWPTPSNDDVPPYSLPAQAEHLYAERSFFDQLWSSIKLVLP